MTAPSFALDKGLSPVWSGRGVMPKRRKPNNTREAEPQGGAVYLDVADKRFLYPAGIVVALLSFIAYQFVFVPISEIRQDIKSLTVSVAQLDERTKSTRSRLNALENRKVTELELDVPQKSALIITEPRGFAAFKKGTADTAGFFAKAKLLSDKGISSDTSVRIAGVYNGEAGKLSRFIRQAGVDDLKQTWILGQELENPKIGAVPFKMLEMAGKSGAKVAVKVKAIDRTMSYSGIDPLTKARKFKEVLIKNGWKQVDTVKMTAGLSYRGLTRQLNGNPGVLFVSAAW